MIDSKERIQGIKDRNFNIVCDFMKENGDVTVASVSKNTGFSLPTVAKIINYAISIGVARKSEVVGFTGGRNAQKYCIIGSYRHTCYIHARKDMIRWCVLDFCGTVTDIGRFTDSEMDIPEKIIEILGKKMKSYNMLNLCAISLPCVVNNGVILDWAGKPSYKGLDLASKIYEQLGIKAIIENDMNILASASVKYIQSKEHYIASAFYSENNIFGMGTVADGRIVSGKNNFAGELCYLPVDVDGISTEEAASKFLTAISSIISPTDIIFYNNTNCNTEKVFRITAEKLPEYAVPDFHVGKDSTMDILDGLINITAEDRKITGCI